jgi:outer membrane protein OmpA-like peptidoglycan-associated protein
MRSIRSLAAIAGAAALLVQAAPAQSAGTIDLGVFARLNWLDASYQTSTGGGGGGRAGWFFMKNLELMADISTSDNNNETDGFPSIAYVPVHVRLEYYIPMKDALSLMVGAGYTHEKFTSQDSSANDSGWGFTFGFRTVIDQRVYAMLSYTGDYSSSPANKGSGAKSSYNQGLELGFGFLLGNKRTEAVPPPAPPPAPTPAPEAAAAAAVVATPADDDHDGVVNTADNCPNTPAGEPVDQYGCSNSQRDDDKDGVKNTADKCPNTPPGEPVDMNGCSASQRDTDGDGVTDDKDHCADTPAGTKVDENGCTLAPLVLEGVKFETNKAILTAGSSVTLDRVASTLMAHPTEKIEIEGYTDDTGDSKYNHALSLKRAETVKAYLVSKGVAADRLTTKGFGEESPLVPNTSAANRQENRRVEIKVVAQ